MQAIANQTYKFPFEQGTSKKTTCPNCGQKRFVLFKNLPPIYGKCDRINSCDYEKLPWTEDEETQKELLKMTRNSIDIETPVANIKTVYPNKEQLSVLNNLTSSFHSFCFNKLNISNDHLQKWNVGTDAKGNTCFVMQTITGNHINIKYMKYCISEDGKNCKRDKAVNFYLAARDKTKEQYKTCLFGEHLLSDKTICLVESEKTAVICSFMYPQFDWLACGGSNGLTVEKVQILKDKTVYYLGDNDKAGKENSSIKKLEKYNINFKQIFFEAAKDGEDLADLVIRGEHPSIKEKEEVKTYIFYTPIYDYDKETDTRSIKDIKINYTIWIELLLSMGYRRFDLGTKEYIFVKIENQILKEITITQIQDEFIDFIKNLKTDNLSNELKSCIIEKFYKNIGLYFNDKRLALLKHDKDFVFNSDTKNSSYVYYKNGFVKITAETWEICDYKTLNGCIWKNQIIDRPFIKAELKNDSIEKSSVFSQFMHKISGSDERFKSLCSIVGYNLHIFFETKLKATILTDSSISEEAEGRTGKTLLAKGLSYIRTYVEISGKNFDTTDKYRYSKCNLDSQIVHNNDVKKYFDFETLYNDITEGITVDKKNKEPFSLRVKYILSSNKTIKMDGASSRDRSIEFELANHYSDTFQPRDEFGHWFFTDWDLNEWNKFDNFMCYCINLYLKNGIIQPSEINLKRRKLIDQTCAEFIEFISAKQIEANIIYNRDEWHKEFLSNYPDIEKDKFKSQLRTFTGYLIIYSANSDKYKKLIKETDLKRSNNVNQLVFRLK